MILSGAIVVYHIRFNHNSIKIHACTYMFKNICYILYFVHRNSLLTLLFIVGVISITFVFKLILENQII